MSPSTLCRRSLWYHRRTHAAIVLGVAAAGAALTGALLVGDSMRASLREVAVGRLGRVEHAVLAPRFFGADLAQALGSVPGYAANYDPPAPLILLAGGATHAESQAHAERVNVLGVDDRFWALSSESTGRASPTADAGRSIVLNEPLARELGAAVGDDVLLRIGRSGAVSPETLLGRRGDDVLSRRLTVHAVIPAHDLGRFGLDHTQSAPRNAYLPLSVLQRFLGREGRANVMLIARLGGSKHIQGFDLQEALGKSLTLADLGLSLRRDEAHGYVALETDAFLLDPAVESAAQRAAEALELKMGSILTYLANSIVAGGDTGDARLDSDRPEGAAPGGSNLNSAGGSGARSSASGPEVTGSAIAGSAGADSDAAGLSGGDTRSIPYSVVTALDATAARSGDGGSAGGEGASNAGLIAPDDSPVPAPQLGQILLNEWAAEDLQVAPGARITLAYYLSGDFGQLDTQRTTFTLAGIVAMRGAAGDPGFTPPYPGVTDTRRISDWDPPFPVNLERVRDKDEQYWEEHRTTPKAFISLDDGLKLWAGRHEERFGRLTSLRVFPPAGAAIPETQQRFEQSLLAQLDPRQLGLAFQDVRRQAETAAGGTTDFGGLFIGFSFFLILSAAMLVALLLRLSTERRAGEIGMMLAVGFAPRRVMRLLLIEALILASAGAALGLAGSAGYAWLMLAGLRSSWSQAVNAPFLQLHVTATSLIIGGCGTIAVAIISMLIALRGLTRRSPRALLAGGVYLEAAPAARPPGRASLIATALLFALAVAIALLPALSGAVAEQIGFFTSGAVLLAGVLVFARRRLRMAPRGLIQRPGAAALLRLGARNAPRHPGRSALTIGLIASATFVITALQAFRTDAASAAGGRQSGTGGFSLVGESTLPLLFDFNSPAGREALGLTPQDQAALADVTVIPLRLRPGDDASCLNLYKPTRHRIAGATPAMIERGGFRFSSVMDFDEQPPPRGHPPNPWRMLDHEFADGAVAAIGDEAAVKWQLHSGLGKDIVVQDDRGRDVRLRFVALLSGSVLQDELIVSESQFARMFPARSGYAFFLIDAPAPREQEVSTVLERALERYGFDAVPAVQRLAGYLAVQNTYLTTFQTLGGLGLVLGTFGLAAVLLRNVWERRSELALMRALGFARRGLAYMVLAENAVLVAAGLAAGLVPALVAITPHLLRRPQSLPWGSLAAILAGVAAAGMISGAIALVPVLRAPLLPSLRRE